MSDRRQGQRNRAQLPSLPNGEGNSPPYPLFPLDRLLQELLQQEEVLWRRNEMHLQSLRAVPANPPVAENSDVSSVRSMATLRSQSSAPTPASDEGPGKPNQAGLYLISYGTLTNVIHKYFRRLEKRHACLYLTGWKARHESLRHVDIHRTFSSEEVIPETLSGSASALLREGGRQLVILKDEELLVYRCALMCSQFPMLSAPSPPDGHSPTPTPPPLPLRFHLAAIGSTPDDIARTAPEGYLTALSKSRAEPVAPHLQRTPDPSHRPTSQNNLDSHHFHITTSPLPTLPTTPPHLGRTSSGDTLKALWPSLDQRMKRTSIGEEGDAPNGVTRTSSGERVKSKPRVADGKESLESPESLRKPLLPEVQSARHPTSSPVPIRGHKSRSRNNSMHSGRDRGKREGDSAVNKKLTSKRLSSEGAALLDSDEEDEIIKLTSHNGKPSSTKSGGSIPNGPLYREHPFSPMVNREMLCNLVRNAFHQTEEQQLQFEQILRHEYGRRSKGEILAKELAGQLQVLENNAHPFYKPKLFVTRNGYDIWLQAEKQRVRTLIDKFWHFSLPRPQLWRHYNPTDYHRAYAILLQKIICIESRTERKEPAYSGRTPSAPLSATAHRLLTEFGLRYGVGVLYRRIVYLDYLAKHFDYEIWYIKHCTEELREIRELLPRNRNKITAVRKEMELLRSTVHLLHGQTDNSLTRIDRLFLDTDPREGVASLIELLAEVLDAEQSLFGKKVRPVEDWLKRYLKSGFALRYMRRKEIAADETMPNRTAQPFVLTPPLVNALLLSIRDEVREYREKFQPVFRPYFDIVPFSKVEFYQLLCADARNLCARMTHRPETRQSLSLEMLGLMYRLNERDMEWENVITPELQLWRRDFVDLALIWMEVLGKQINQWIRMTVAKDQWTMLTFSSSVPASQDASRPSTETIPTPQIVRNSPFPSPTFSNRTGTASILGSLGSGYGAFSPYPRAVLKRHTQKSPPQSESSGAVTDITNSTSSMESGASIPIGEIPDVVLKGARKGAKSSPAGSLLNFGTGTAKGRGEEETVGFSSTVDPPEEIEVPASAYESYSSDSKSPSVNQESESLAEPPPMPNGNGTTAPGFKVLEWDPTEEHKVSTPCSEENPISDKPNSVGVDTEDVLSHDNPMLLQGDLSLGKDLATPDEALEDHAATQNHVSPAKDLASGPIDVIVQVVSPVEQKSHSLPTEVKTVQERNSKTKARRSHKSSQKHTTNSDLNPNLLIDAMDPPASLSAPGTNPMVKFGNILDRCTAEDAGVVEPKPRVVKPSRTIVSHVGFAQSEDESHIPPASVGTVPELAKWAKEHPGCSFLEDGHSGSGSAHTSPSYHDSQDTPKNSPSVEVNTDVEGSLTTPTPEEERTASSYRFPVSSSPIDIITMLTRLSTFTGVLLGVLTPKLKPHTMPPEVPKVTHEYPSEVAMARQQAMQQWKLAQDMKTEFLKKLHKAMVNSLKLYADNLLCMDLCWWSGREAMKLLGEQMVHHLRRRKETGEIWGCRHMVEARHGLHPLGIPCQKKSSTKFENITRDMCIRINNIHTVITVFTSLESHLHASSRTEVLKPTNPFGYISSDPVDLGYRGATHQLRPNTHTRQQPTQQTHLAPGDPFTRGVTGSFSWPSTASPGLGAMEPDERSGDSRQLRGRERERPETGFRSRESLHTLEYLRNVQKIQIRILCIRMNKFFKPALSLLLELKLGECSIEKRLYPLTTFLTRHRSALQKYIYPECFSTTMKYMWDYILQDLEEEAVKLRTVKRPITKQAQMILQAFSHLVEFMHDRGNGLELDCLTSSSEYLLGLLEIMTRSTDQLISIFNKLSAPHFARSRLDLSRSPIPVDSGVLHALRVQLHTYKKCFTGREFVDKILEMGRLYESMSENPSEADTDSQVPQGESSRNSSRLSARVISSTGQPIVYTVQYATEVAQYLLNERILLPLPDTSLSTGMLTPATSSDEDNTLGGSTPKDPHPFLTSMERKKGIDTTRPLRQGSVDTNSSESPHLVPRVSPLYPRSIHSAVRDQGRAEEQEREMPAPEFSYSSQAYYKFADAEDFESNMLYQSMILAASTRGVQGGSRTMEPDEPSEFHRARNSTLFLVFDLIVQRAHKERRAKQFRLTPRAVTVSEQKRDSELSMNCDLIFKM